MVEFRTVARATKMSFHLEVGAWDPHRFEGQGGFEFGLSAEVSGSFVYSPGDHSQYEKEIPIYRVSMGAIMAHSPEIGRLRLRAYEYAIGVAERCRQAGFTFEEAEHQFDDLRFQVGNGD